MWCAIQVTGRDGKTLWVSNPDRNGRRSVGTFENAAVFWQTKHTETVIGLYMRQKNAGAAEIRIVDLGDRILSEAPMA